MITPESFAQYMKTVQKSIKMKQAQLDSEGWVREPSNAGSRQGRSTLLVDDKNPVRIVFYTREVLESPH